MRKFPSLKKTKAELDKMLLLSAINGSMMSADETLEDIIMSKRAEILSNHEATRSIWQNQSNGRWCTKLGKEKHLIMRKERSDLENAIVEYYLTKDSVSATFEDVFEDWCERAIEIYGIAMKTINEYRYDYNRMVKGSDFSKMLICTITEMDLVHFLKDVVYGSVPEKLPSKRFGTLKTILRHMFNHAKIEMNINCICIKNVIDDISFPSTAFKCSKKNDDSQVFKLSEINVLKKELDATNDLKELGIALTMETGLRVGELCTLRREDYTGIELIIRHSEHKARFDDGFKYFIGEPKMDKVRKVVLSAKAIAIIEKILAMHSSEWLFPSDDDTTWTRSYYFDKKIRKLCRKVNIPERSMHKLRKTYASYLLSKGINEKIVQKQLGHSDISTTQKAYHYDIYDTDNKVNILRDLEVG